MNLNAAGAYLRELRKQQGFSQTKLAEMVGVTNNTIWRIEKGTQEPQAALIVALLAVLRGSAAHVHALLSNPKATNEEAEQYAALQKAIEEASPTSRDAFRRYLDLVAAGVDPTVAARQVLDQ